MPEITLLQFGVGGVGRALVRQILDTRDILAQRAGLTLKHVALVDSGGAILKVEGLSDEELRAVLQAKGQGQGLKDTPWGQAKTGDLDIIRGLETERAIVVDVTAASGMEEVLTEALGWGYGLALANKRPLTASWAAWQTLAGSGRLRHEATVGAGLPVIATLRYLLDTGDAVKSIEGCFSGTVGYICTQLEEETPFSSAVAEAKERGYTEPDPRDDLGGLDVARKALILARMLGWKMGLKDVEVEALYPSDMAALSVDEFMDALPRLDQDYARQTAQARAEGKTLRYVASVRDGRSWVSLRAVDRRSSIGTLKGTDNIVAIESERYSPHPLVLIGRGAGVEATAAGVLGDIIALAREGLGNRVEREEDNKWKRQG